MINVDLTGLGSYVPETIGTNEDIAQLPGVNTTPEWIREHTGVTTRRIASPQESLPVMMAIAAKRAMDDAGLSPQDIDRIYVATNGTDPILVPQLSSRVQYLIGAREIPCQDVQAGCTGAIYAIENAVRTIRDIKANEGRNERALVIGGDTLFNVVNSKDRNSLPILADGAGAVVLEPINDGGRGIKHMLCGADGSMGGLIHFESGFTCSLVGKNTLRLENTGEMGYFKMIGKKIHGFVIKKSAELVKKLIEGSGLDLEALTRTIIIPHQMNDRTLESAYEEIVTKLGYKPKLFYRDSVRIHGNTSPASTLIGADDLQRRGELDVNNYVMFIAFGSGLTWGGLLTGWSRKKETRGKPYTPEEGRALVEEFNGRYQQWLTRLA